MEKATNEMKEWLRDEFAAACNGYLDQLLRMWELDAYYGYWNSDQPGTIYHYGETHNLSMEEIIFIVENDVEEDTVLEWEDYCLEAYEFKFNSPNLAAWCRGCPRVPKEQFEKCRQLRKELEELVANENERVRNF